MDIVFPSPRSSPTPLVYTDDGNFEDAQESLHFSPAPHRAVQYTPEPLSNTTAPAFLTPNAFTPPSDFLYPGPANYSRSSVCSTAATTPAHSRSASPSPLFYSFVPSSYLSETDSEPSSPSFTATSGRPWSREDNSRRRWWAMGNTLPARRRRRGRYGCGLRSFKRLTRSLCRRPFVPKQPLMIVRPAIKAIVF
jgi:hypothetical protein